MSEADDPGAGSESVHRAIVGRGGGYTIATVAPILVSIALTPVLTRALGPEQYGLVAIGISIFRVGAMVLPLGLAVAVTRNAIVERSGARGASALVLTGSIVACVLGVAGILTIPLWSSWVVGGTNPALLIAPFISSLGVGMTLLAQAYFRALDKVASYVSLAFGISFACPTVGIVGVWLFGSSAASYLWPLAWAQLMVGIGAVVCVVVNAPPTLREVNIGRAYAIALPTLPHQVSSAFLSSSLVVIAGVVLGQNAAGSVQIALLLGTAPMVVLSAMNNAWAPMVYRSTDDSRPRVLSESTRLVAAVMLVIMAGYVMAVEPLSKLIAGPAIASPSFVEAAVVPTLGVAFMIVYLANIQLVFMSGKTGFLGVTTPVSAVATVSAVALILTVTRTENIAILTSGIAVFYVLMAAWSVPLRRRSGHIKANLVSSLPYLAAIFVLGATWSLVPIPWWFGCCVFVLISFIVGFQELRALRRVRSKGI